MGVLSSVRAVRWARKHQPEQVRFVSGDRPHDALRVYGEHVLPELRG